MYIQKITLEAGLGRAETVALRSAWTVFSAETTVAVIGLKYLRFSGTEDF